MEISHVCVVDKIGLSESDHGTIRMDKMPFRTWDGRLEATGESSSIPMIFPRKSVSEEDDDVDECSTSELGGVSTTRALLLIAEETDGIGLKYTFNDDGLGAQLNL
jgi:hypothetical protein